jgi:hypothetical protein
MGATLGSETLELEVVVDKVDQSFTLDGISTKVIEVTATPALNIPLPVKSLDDTGLNIANRLPSALGQLARALSLGVTLSTEDITLLTSILSAFTNGQLARAGALGVTLSPEDVAILNAIKTATEAKGKLGYVDAKLVKAGTTPITVAGLDLGAIAAATYKTQIQNQTANIRVEVGGVVLGYALAGAEFDIDCDGLTGDIIVYSETGSDIGSGQLALNFLG